MTPELEHEIERHQNRIKNLAQSLADGLEYLADTETRTTDAVTKLQESAISLNSARDKFEKNSELVLASVNRDIGQMPNAIAEKVAALVGKDVKVVVDGAISNLREVVSKANTAASELCSSMAASHRRMVLYAILGGALAGGVSSAVVNWLTH